MLAFLQGNPNLSGASLSFPFATSQSLVGSGATLTFTRASAQTYFDSTGTLQSAATDVAAFDYNPTTLAPLGLSLWEARTNSFLQSPDISNAAWTKVRSTAPGTTTTAPDGTAAGQKLVEDSSTNTHFVRQDVAVTAGTAYTWSFYAKAGERTQFIPQFGSDAGVFAGEAAIFTLSGSGSVTNSGSTNPSIQALPNGWYRCVLTATCTGTGTGVLRNQLGSGGVASYTGNGTSGAFLWGAQFETGAFVTPYIVTAGATATRAASVCSTTDLSWYVQNVGTWGISAMTAIASSGANQFLARTSDNSYNNQVSVGLSTTGFPAIATASGGVFDGSATSGTLTVANTLFKVAAAFAANDLAISCNGTTVVTDAALTAPVAQTQLNIGSDHGGFNHLNGWLAALTYYPRRLPNATLQALSA